MRIPLSHQPVEKQDAYAYIQVSMGMIHPDYVYINHFLHERDEDNSKDVKCLPEKEKDASILSVKSLHDQSGQTKMDRPINIYFHSRKDVRS